MVCCGDIRYVDLICVSEFTHVMKSQIDVATAFEIDWMFGMLNASCVVFIYEGWTGLWVTEFVQKHVGVDECAGTFEG